MPFLRSYYFLSWLCALVFGLLILVAVILFAIIQEDKREAYINSCPYTQGEMVVIDLTGMSARIREVRIPSDNELRDKGECVYEVFNGHAEVFIFESELRSH